MGGDGVPFRNAEGYADPTAYEAMNNALRDQLAAEAEADERMNLLVKTLKNTIRLACFELVSRIEIKDAKTGRVYR